jgi:hypothetical protein
LEVSILCTDTYAAVSAGNGRGTTTVVRGWYRELRDANVVALVPPCVSDEEARRIFLFFLRDREAR